MEPQPTLTHIKTSSLEQLLRAYNLLAKLLTTVLAMPVLGKPQIAFLLIFYSSAIIAQQTDTEPTLNYNQILERLSRINPTMAPMQGVPRPKPNILGSSFLNEKFAYTTFLISDGQKSQPYFTKYNMLFDEFLVIKGGAYYTLPGKAVLSFSWIDSIRLNQYRFVRFDLFKTTRPSTAKFIEILVDGKLTLAKAIEAVVADPNYNVALDAGRRDAKIFTKEILLYVRNDTVFTLPPVKQIPMLFKKHRPFMDQFIEINHFDLKNERDLTIIFEFFNERVERLKEN